MKKLILIIPILFALNTVNAQKIKLKNQIVYLDKQEFLRYEDRILRASEFSILSLDSAKEIIFVMFMNNGTREYKEDDYVRIEFVKEKIVLETSRGYFIKGYIRWFLENKLINDDGTLNYEQIVKFKSRYHENFENRPVRYYIIEDNDE